MNNNLLRINLTEGTVITEKIPDSVVFQYIGGTGYLSYFLYRELKAKIDPLGPENKIIIAPGPAQGTRIPITGRYAVGAKSPLTNHFLDSHVGGFLGPEIRFAGYDLIIIEGKADKPVYISIKDDIVEIKDAANLWGKLSYQTEDMIREEQKEPKMRVICIGPAGENLVTMACLTADSHRNPGRGGLGAVFGSKNLKAVAVKGSSKPTNGNQEKIDELRKEILARTKIAKEAGSGMFTYGTSDAVNFSNEMSQYPTRNWQSGVFEEHEKVGGVEMAEKYKAIKRPCYGCPIGCSHTLDASVFEWTDKKEIARPEYETLALLGGNVGISNNETIIHANYLCNQLGLDTISAGSGIAMVMEAVEKGLLKGEEFEGIRFGNDEKVLEMLEQIAYRKGIGAILAKGNAQAAKEWGIEHLAIHVKGLPFAAWDPRGRLGLGLSYSTAAVGASHLRGWPQTQDIPDKSAVEVIDSLKEQQDYKTLLDCLVVCSFSYSIDKGFSFADRQNILSALWDREVSDEELMEIAQRIWITKRLFNISQYQDEKPIDYDVLPKRFMNEPLPSGRAKGSKAFISEDDYNKSLQLLYRKRGLDEFGVPEAEEIKKLGIL
ncbi:MAG: aldehyde ferredoxin oxidoreductase family protein [Candidatus Heimdallarchaeota archaeon]|nr:aldehyde ferredoxin oxidoreductase family protein [Candidatus Heimdallarchaeota archaeon]